MMMMSEERGGEGGGLEGNIKNLVIRSEKIPDG
jgi:hypothetical protein